MQSFSNLIIICYLIFFHISCKSGERFTCPIQNASIILVEKKGAEVTQAPFNAELIGNKTKVSSMSNGIVYMIDSSNGDYNVSIKYQQYIFTYGNLKSILIRDGQIINKGEPIGIMAKSDTLELAMIKNGFPQRVQKYLKCNVKTVYVDY